MKRIEVFGPGCPNCRKTADFIERIATEKGMTEGDDYVLIKVTNPSDIAARGILATPGVAVDGEVVSRGKIPKKDTIEGWLSD